MIAERRTLTADDRRLLDRDHAIHDALTYTIGCCGLAASGEADLRTAAMRHIEPILALTDDATAARVELEAIDRRLDAHARTHLGCTYEVPCWRYRTLQVRRNRLQASYDRAYRALLAGRQR